MSGTYKAGRFTEGGHEFEIRRDVRGRFTFFVDGRRYTAREFHQLRLAASGIRRP